jgi:hypothetical protein
MLRISDWSMEFFLHDIDTVFKQFPKKRRTLEDLANATVLPNFFKGKVLVAILRYCGTVKQTDHTLDLIIILYSS